MNRAAMASHGSCVSTGFGFQGRHLLQSSCCVSAKQPVRFRNIPPVLFCKHLSFSQFRILKILSHFCLFMYFESICCCLTVLYICLMNFGHLPSPTPAWPWIHTHWNMLSRLLCFLFFMQCCVLRDSYMITCAFRPLFLGVVQYQLFTITQF